MIDGILGTLTWFQMAFILTGVFSGIVVGAIPGLTGSMLIALTLPITFHMSPLHATTLLVAMYVGSIAGGLITATLLRMPGSPAAVMTTLDGYPLAKSGQPGRALGFGITASFIGSLIAWVALATISEPLSELAVRLTPFDYFALVMMAMALIASVAGGDVIKGLIAGFLGMLVTFPGIDPSGGEIRLTFGTDDLIGGFKLLPVLIGVFAVSQIFADALDMKSRQESVAFSGRGMFMSFRDLREQAVNLVRSSLVGTFIGILPGVGASVGSALAYLFARLGSKTPERFGRGSEEGIVASEAANNATVGGALIPLISLGIPGSVTDAILIGALTIHSLQPGPMLFTTNPDIVWNVIGVYFVSTFVMLGLMVALIRLYVRVSTIPKSYLLPVIMVFCVVGVYSLNNTMFDVWTMLVFGVVGFLLERAGFNLGPFVIGYVLAKVAEAKLRQGLMFTDGDITPLFTEPLSLGMLIAALALLVWSLWAERRRQVSQTLRVKRSES
ncbi:MAG: tripartite tricarboxylate transporter permease [Paracoccaceae bacterium]|nr:tripartite tricarboxylate transporter permease [Paracoccaceae bacterium]MDE2911955.1 tripartite tricarboxylate transporter permease [Paracoccaceae bacterium]